MDAAGTARLWAAAGRLAAPVTKVPYDLSTAVFVVTLALPCRRPGGM